jgi:putative ABC transport system substrate-binding protein
MEEVEGKVDVLWSVADSTVFTPQGLRHILLSTLRNRIPFVGLSPAFVKAGALLALSCDYQDVGSQSGEMAIRILEGESPDTIPTAVPRQVSLSVNMNTARQIKVAIADEVRDAAANLF